MQIAITMVTGIELDFVCEPDGSWEYRPSSTDPDAVLFFENDISWVLQKLCKNRMKNRNPTSE